MKKFNTFKVIEELEHNINTLKQNGYNPKYKPGYFLIRFIDEDSKENNFGHNFTSNNRFLKRFGEIIGAELAHKDQQTNDLTDYIVYFTKPGSEIECMEKAKSYDFVLDAELYDNKYYVILNLFEKINDELTDYYEFNMLSDDDLNDKLDKIEDIIKEIRENV